MTYKDFSWNYTIVGKAAITLSFRSIIFYFSTQKVIREDTEIRNRECDDPLCIKRVYTIAKYMKATTCNVKEKQATKTAHHLRFVYNRINWHIP